MRYAAYEPAEGGKKCIAIVNTVSELTNLFDLIDNPENVSVGICDEKLKIGDIVKEVTKQ